MSTGSSSPGFRLVQAPNHTWTYGEKIDATPEGRKWMEGVKTGWKGFDMASEDPRQMNLLLISGVVPRPIAFVSTLSDDGIGNLAPFRKNPVDGGPKDTINNIRANKQFTVNIISEPWAAQANASYIDAPKEISEWDISGLTKEPSTRVKPPRVRESAFSIECELFQTIDIMDPATSTVATTLVLGSVKYVHARNDVLNERGVVDPGKLMPVGRMSGITFSKVNEGFELRRYSWKADGEEVKEVLARSKL